MGTDLDDTLEKLNELRSQIKYWFDCIDRGNDPTTKGLLDLLEYRLIELDPEER